MHSFLLRGQARIAAFVLALGVLAIVVPAALHPHQAFAGTTSILDYVAMPGDQVVTVPNGTYSAGTVTAVHPATSGGLRGWLVLVAQTPGGVVVDQSPP